MAKLYRIGWSHEGFMWRRGMVTIKQPDKFSIFWKIRRVNGTEGKLEAGECDESDEKTAFKKANELYRRMRREKR